MWDEGQKTMVTGSTGGELPVREVIKQRQVEPH